MNYKLLEQQLKRIYNNYSQIGFSMLCKINEKNKTYYKNKKTPHISIVRRAGLGTRILLNQIPNMEEYRQALNTKQRKYYTKCTHQIKKLALVVLLQIQNEANMLVYLFTMVLSLSLQDLQQTPPIPNSNGKPNLLVLVPVQTNC